MELRHLALAPERTWNSPGHAGTSPAVAHFKQAIPTGVLCSGEVSDIDTVFDTMGTDIPEVDAAIFNLKEQADGLVDVANPHVLVSGLAVPVNA